MPDKKGVALIEVIIIVAVIAILAGILTPLLYKSSEADKIGIIKKELEKIYNSCIGDMKNNFGYIGDMGKLPDSLTDLYIQGSQPSPIENPTGSGIYSGWRGPYINIKNSDSTGIKDPYGNYYIQFYLQLNSNNPCSNSDTKCRWFIMSAGKDGNYDSSNPLDTSINDNKDNIYFPATPLIIDRAGAVNTIYSTITLKTIIAREQASPSRNIKFTVYYPNSGTPALLESNFINPASFTIPAGNRFVESFIINDNGDIFSPNIGKNILFLPNINKIEYLKFNSTLENLNIINLTLTQQVCPVSTCVSPCNIICCNGSMTQCTNSPIGLWLCQISGCYSLCCAGSGSSNCALNATVDSSLNVNGTISGFNLYIEGYDQNGVKLLGPIIMQKNSSSPFFSYTNNSADCNIKTIRIYSTGGGGNITKNI